MSCVAAWHQSCVEQVHLLWVECSWSGDAEFLPYSKHLFALHSNGGTERRGSCYWSIPQHRLTE